MWVTRHKQVTVDTKTSAVSPLSYPHHIDTDGATERTARMKVFGQLVALGFDVTVFTPAPYQRRRLRRPSEEL